MLPILATLAVSISLFVPGCFGLGPPADADVVRDFAPIGRWAGHWGIDIAAPVGTRVFAAGDGTVRFSGTVVHNFTVSVDHGGGVVTSYSYLAEITVRRGDSITKGSPVGVAGIHDGRSAFHMSLRVAGRYVDPMALTRCKRSPSSGLYLAVDATTYAVGRARDPRRYFRSAS
jgi:murein DD-endopeptidase MepM/ murein hydrolase activator NlpD